MVEVPSDSSNEEHFHDASLAEETEPPDVIMAEPDLQPGNGGDKSPDPANIPATKESSTAKELGENSQDLPNASAGQPLTAEPSTLQDPSSQRRPSLTDPGDPIPGRKARAKQPARFSPPEGAEDYPRDDEESASEGNQTRQERRMDAHYLAHRITLQALLGEEDALRKYPFVPPAEQDAPPLKPSKKNQRETHKRPPKAKLSSVRQYQPIPSQADAASPSSRNSFTRSPFLGSTDNLHSNPLASNPLASNPPDDNHPAESRANALHEVILAISVRRSNRSGQLLTTTLTIPPAEMAGPLHSTIALERERHAQTVDFDDEHLFKQLRRSYHSLVHPFVHFLSARTLTRIVVMNTEDGLMSGLDEGGLEYLLLQLFREPGLGHGRHDFVTWARGEAAAAAGAPPLVRSLAAVQETIRSQQRRRGGRRRHSAVPEFVTRRMSEIEVQGFEFVFGWSASRVLFVLFLIVGLMLMTVLLFILGGWVPVSGVVGDRVPGGMLLAIAVFLAASVMLGGWLTWSWITL